MKRVLVTGAGSYLGTSFVEYTKGKLEVDTVDLIDGSWRNKSFSGYESVYHVAGLAHSDTGKVSDERKAFYYKINTELAIETAQKAKADGVKQFIFMSSAIVYGDSAPIGKKKVITKETEPAPANFYGDSKLKAEMGIKKLEDKQFKVVIIRSAMVYGKGCKGNYSTLSMYAQKVPIFPYVMNERSMIYVENLMEFVRLMVVNEENGMFWPQNGDYTNTSEMVRAIAETHGKKVWLVRGFGWALKMISYITPLVNKVFGNQTYDKKLSEYKHDYHMVGLKESIERTES